MVVAAALMLAACASNSAPDAGPRDEDAPARASVHTPAPRVTAAAVDGRAGASGTVTVTLPSPSPSPEPGNDEPSTATGGSDAGEGLGAGSVRRTGTSAVVGDGTPGSCTSAALAQAVRPGGDVSFDCGPSPHTIVLEQTLVLCNTHTCAHPWKGGEPVSHLTVDGGGLVTLSGGGARGIFYANSCEESFGWLSGACQDETVPHVTFRSIGFVDGNASATPPGVATLPGGGGGGAIAMRGGQLTVDGAWFSSNRCVSAHSDAGGGAIRVTGMRAGATITNSRFTGNRCANGGAVSSLQAPLRISGSTFTDNTATGSGASSGSGGNGGAVYFDGTAQDVRVAGSTMTGNVAPEGGPAVFYVSNDGSGSLTIDGSTLTGNSGESFHTAPYRDIFFKGRTLHVTGATVE